MLVRVVNIKWYVHLMKTWYSNVYELCKDLTRNNKCITMDDIKAFIKNLDIDEKIKKNYMKLILKTILVIQNIFKQKKLIFTF